MTDIYNHHFAQNTTDILVIHAEKHGSFSSVFTLIVEAT